METTVYEPEGQPWHGVEVFELKVPDVQAVHWLEPPRLKLPGVQEVHAVAPIPLANVPARQAEQLLDDIFLYCPEEQKASVVVVAIVVVSVVTTVVVMTGCPVTLPRLILTEYQFCVEAFAVHVLP